MKNDDLISWMKEYDKNFFDNNKFNEERKEIFDELYQSSKSMRNHFYDNYISNLSNNLNTKSDRNIYKYLNFFTKVEPKPKNYYGKYKKEEIRYYDDNSEITSFTLTGDSNHLSDSYQNSQ